MKRTRWMIVLLVLALGYWNCGFEEYEPVPVPSKLVTLEINSAALADNFIGDPAVRNLTVYVPYDYIHRSETKAYPVAYLLHGVPFGEKAFVDPMGWVAMQQPPFQHGPDFPDAGFKAWIDGLMESGEIEEMIIVMPDATTSYGFSFYTNSTLLGNYQDYIAEDVVKLIDDTYRTIAAPEGRAVIGVSQGGYGAMKMAMTRPGIFGTVGVHSAPLDFEMVKRFIPFVLMENFDSMHGPETGKFLTTSLYAMAAAWSPNMNNPPYYVDLPFDWPSPFIKEAVWARWQQHDPLLLLQQYQNNLRSLAGLNIDCGRQDEFRFNECNQMFHQALEQAGIQHQYEIHNGAHFSETYASIRNTLQLFSDNLRGE